MTDMHVHTLLSDGGLAADEICLLAKGAGLDGVAITDHDTLYGGDEQIHGVRVIPGVEMSAADEKRGRRVHILCYLWKDAAPLSALCDNILAARRTAGEIMAERVTKLYPLTKEFILKRAAGSRSVYKQHIMKALMDAGYSLSVFGDMFSELFRRGGAVREEISYPGVYEVLSAAKAAGAVTVLAHPPVYDSFELAEELVDGGYIDGIEVRHTRNRPGDEEYLSQLADRRGLIKTGGSDFHGMFSSREVQLGMCATPADELERLMQRAGR